MYKLNIINKSDRVHLLGCALPQEFRYYKDFPFIESIDTSNPIIHGLEGIKYSPNGLYTKSSTKIDQVNIIPLTQEILYTINHNLTQFKKYLNDDK
jgi:hypothetical protein